MDIKRTTFTTTVQDAPLELEVSSLGGQANAAVVGKWGETVVLATVVMGKQEVLLDYFPLTVDYEERFYAAGKIIGSRFVRREGRPSDEAILSARLIDRTIRPLFDSSFRREVQVVVTILAYDEEHDPDLVSLIAVSTALGISDVPWAGPVGGARMEARDADGRLRHLAFFAGTEQTINMIEFEGNEVAEDDAVKLFQAAQAEIARLAAFQREVIKKIGKPKCAYAPAAADPRVKSLVAEFVKSDLAVAIREKRLGELKFELLDHLKRSGEAADAVKAADRVFEELIDEYVHERILKHDERPDGRALDELRPLHGETGLFSRTHGSGLFIRGNTQVLSVVTLGSPSAEQLVETMEETGKKRFMLHYNFPSFSVGETGRSRGPGRREIGHGALAAKALRALIPPKDAFPYTIRVVAETLSSNGSSSMATTCASSLALHDAGVPMRKHAAGIAMGLMIEPNVKAQNSKLNYKILTDIQGPEDHHGDMDFKAAGTRDGLTAIQMDVKIDGISAEIFRETLAQAKKARLEILNVMEGALAAPRAELSKYAPLITTLKINPERIGEVIGPGGKMIHSIIDATENKVAIDIEDDGTIFVTTADKAMGEKAIGLINEIVRELTPGEMLEGPIVKILEFGAIVDLGGKKDGMVHVSELGGEGFVKNVSDVVKVGQRVRVKVVRVEPNGRIALTMKGVKQGQI